LVSEASTDGTLLFAWSTRLVVTCTTWPPSSWRSILRDGQLRGGEKAGEVDPDQGLVVLGGVVG